MRKNKLVYSTIRRSIRIPINSLRQDNGHLCDRPKLAQVSLLSVLRLHRIIFCGLVSRCCPSGLLEKSFDRSSSSNVVVDRVQRLNQERNLYEQRIEINCRNDLREKYNIPPPFERQWLRQPRYVPQERPQFGQMKPMNDWKSSFFVFFFLLVVFQSRFLFNFEKKDFLFFFFSYKNEKQINLIASLVSYGHTHFRSISSNRRTHEPLLTLTQRSVDSMHPINKRNVV